MKILLDTNILVHAYNQASPYQEVARNIIERAMAGEIQALIAQQVLFEFFVVITNAKRVELPLPPDKAAELCLDLWECDEIEKIAASELVPREVFNLVKSKRLSGSSIFDCILAVSAKVNKIDVIYTENVRDFNKYGFIKVQNPFIQLYLELSYLGQEVFTDRLVLLINNKSNGRSKDQLWTAAAELSAANLPQTHAEEDKGYSVQVVESLGCISQGKTIKQAIANIKDAIPGYLEAFPDELVEPI